MVFSHDWERAFDADTHVSRWPWTDLVTYVKRYARREAGYIKVLEIGCAAGANAAFFRAEGFEYFGIDGSKSAINKLVEFYPDLAKKVNVCDFTRDLHFEGPFDLIVDRGALTCNSIEDAERALKMIYDALRPGGKYIGIDWFSTNDRNYKEGEQADKFTRKNIRTGRLANLGEIQFVDGQHLSIMLMSLGFTVDRLEEKISRVDLPVQIGFDASWHVVATK